MLYSYSKKTSIFLTNFLCHFYYIIQHGLSAAALLIFKYYVIHSCFCNFAPPFFEAPAPYQFLLQCANPVSKLPKVQSKKLCVLWARNKCDQFSLYLASASCGLGSVACPSSRIADFAFTVGSTFSASFLDFGTLFTNCINRGTENSRFDVL